MNSIRSRTEQIERETLAPYASLSAESRGRAVEEQPDSVRTCFQRDRDRILHSKSFRRLMHKTQVFIRPEQDHYRTRLTHTLEVAQISRTVARALRLNEDLTEAIALGHDVGHTPFGHAGEHALDEAVRSLRPNSGFKHYEQSVRVLQQLERDGQGLNLCVETIEGVAGHSKGRTDIGEFDPSETPSLEAAVVRLCDRIAYLNHDLDDAVRAGWMSLEALPKDFQDLGASHSQRISAMVSDIIETSASRPAVEFSAVMARRLNSMKEYLFENVYLTYSKEVPDVKKAQHVVTSLFRYYVEHEDSMPEAYTGFQGAIDYLSGMTDRFAIRQYEALFVPSAWA
ncbi:deoxyguanosinetriphosphate triphosphohydrolase [Fimbriimonadia bacterium ATM]|nr:MAG: deoxyguanosinetriphosphate triphosphohydrolase [Armatimonadota bacterium]MBC6970254.1 deoxyguanosinetriphosphate triphosphohydrolase [Armatimonadota bacterium]MCE7899566.1 deoxyguanosinetriphosphate triphosphohydrolase [Armatimonadetes bacterium ATM1]MDL1927654.1 deoxyguanosinetriphosphate triphosphohydrolase [Fimbriimonadia bacterium ATM]RIJ96420.1 MAG: deoxyguanosinetriphosphate triphosphohydrolase [Armatimonadota bacterium]